jgi:RNA polymerase sigma-B factor
VTATAGRLGLAIGPSELFARWQRNGDDRARDLLVEQFLPLARSLARRYVRSSEPLEDLVQIASLGLLNAIDRFDPSRGLAFSSFAVPTILGELKRHFRDHSWSLKVPRGAQERAHKITEAQEQISAGTGRAPTVSELAQYLKLSDEEVLDGLLATQAYDTASLDTPRPSHNDPNAAYPDALGHEDERFALIDDAATIRGAFKYLPPRERQILYLRFGEDLTQTAIARQIGVSQMEVSRLLRKSLARLRDITDDSPPASDRVVVIPDPTSANHQQAKRDSSGA